MIDIAASLEDSKHQDAEGCCKTIPDLARYRIVLERVKPRCIVELGTFSGKSALWFANEADCPVITVDTHGQVALAERAAAHGRIVWLNGSSTDQGIIDQITGFVYGCGTIDGQPQAFVVLDSDHSAPHVLRELNAYARLVPVGGYIIVEDGLLRWMDPAQQAYYDGNPLDAIEQWLPEHPEFENDEDLEGMYPSSQFPGGWLRRLR